MSDLDLLIEELVKTTQTWAIASIGSGIIAYLFYFLAGLIGSLFPCVYPLYPITAGFLRNRTQVHLNEATWKHPLIYCCGMILTYGLLGLLAAAGGGAFNQIMQNGLFIIGTGFLFLFLAFVSLDWYNLRWNWGDHLGSKIASKEGSISTFLMGNVAGLVASACTAPVLVSMLIFVAQNSAQSNTGEIFDILYGSSLCLAFGGGMSLPFFVTGVLGTRLPRSGRWQIVVKIGFAGLIGLVAIYQMKKGFTVMGWDDQQIYIIFLGMLLLFMASIIGLQPPKKTEIRAELVKFYFSLLCLAFGIGLIVHGLAKPNSLDQAKSFGNRSVEYKKYEDIAGLRFYRNRDFALDLARQKRQPVFIDFYADWCANCKDFLELVQTNKTLQAALKKAVLLKIYDTDPIFNEFQNDKQMLELKIGLPFFAVIEHSGRLLWKTTNYRDISGMVRAIKKASL